MMGFGLFVLGLVFGLVGGHIAGYQDGWEARSDLRDYHRRKFRDR